MKHAPIPTHNLTVGAARPGRASKTLLSAVVLALGLAGCSVLPKRPPPHALTTYLITLPSTQPTKKSSSSCPALRIATPTAAAGFTGSAMRYSESSDTIASFAFHRWAAAPVRMITPLLVQTMSNSGLFTTVLDADAPGTAPLQLDTQLVTLVQQIDGTQSHVHLVMRVTLTDLVAHNQIAARRFVVNQPANAAAPGAGARATDAAVARWTDELLTWIKSEHLCPAQ